MFPNEFEEGLVDGDMIAFSCCAALEYGLDNPADVNFNQIAEVMDNKLIFLKRYLGIKKLRVFLSDKYNFRYDVAHDYKSNRDGVWRPYNLANAKAHLIAFWNAEQEYGLEADDLMAIHQDKVNNTTVIITLDKDLKQVPGCHYSWERKDIGEKKQIVTSLGHLELNVKERTSGGKTTRTKEIKGDGFLFFMHQLLIGDPTDGVMGCGKRELKTVKSGKNAGNQVERRVGIGAVESYEALKDCKTKSEAFQKVRHLYQCIHEPEDWKNELLKNARLVHMLDKMPDEHGVITLWHFNSADKESSMFSLKEKVFLNG